LPALARHLVFAKSRTRSPAGHGNRRGGGVALPALAFARMRAPECRSAARLLRTSSESPATRWSHARSAAIAIARDVGEAIVVRLEERID
jgi:hypothetical protein